MSTREIRHSESTGETAPTRENIHRERNEDSKTKYTVSELKKKILDGLNCKISYCRREKREVAPKPMNRVKTNR